MKILLLAGEESGVLYAERLRAEILTRCPEAEFRGYETCGFKIGDLAVMGVGQVLKKIFYFLRVRRTMEREIDRWRPDVVCTVDYPGMNLRLAAYAKAKGIRTVHVVCPQVWAWKAGRIPKIEAALDKLCCFFPFEPALFRPGFAEFVGHPLADEMRQMSTRRGGSGEKALALLPGSRMGEIEKHVPILLAVVEKLQAEMPELRVIIPAANDRAFARIMALLPPGAPNLRVTRGDARAALQTAAAAVVASGTATLEAALIGCPTVLVYRVGWFFALLARCLVKGVRHIGLANIVAEKVGAACPMPELLQKQFTVENVVACLKPWLTDETAGETARQALAKTREWLLSDGQAMARMARLVLN